jgi:apolipoprotein N-acyltransferase
VAPGGIVAAGSPVVDVHVGGRTIRVAPLVCYDAVDERNVARAVRAGARLIVTLSNDSWLADGAGAELHFVVSAFRSIETRRPQVRATTTGISAVVTPVGEVVASAGIHERAGLVASVAPVRDVLPLAVRWGNWMGPAGSVLALAILVTGRRKRE